jgi:uncharacterized coiled-coil DUF342 family protein
VKILGFLNLAGVLLLAALCTVQWGVNRRVTLQAIRLDKTRQEQAQKIDEQAKAIKGYLADLNELRDRLERSEMSLQQTESKLKSMTADRDQAIAQRDQYAADLAKWTAAVKERDEALKKANEEITTIVAARNEAIQKLNDLAIKYNGVVKDLNEARAKAGSGR